MEYRSIITVHEEWKSQNSFSEREFRIITGEIEQIVHDIDMQPFYDMEELYEGRNVQRPCRSLERTELFLAKVIKGVRLHDWTLVFN